MMKEKEEKREFWPLVLFPLWDIFWSTSSSPFYTYYIPFRSSGSQEFNASNGVQIGVETKKLWSLQENWTELSGNFAHLNPRCEKFRTVRNHLLAHECHFAHLKPIFTPCETRCKIHSKVRKSQFKVHQFRTPQSKVRKIFAPCETLSWHTSAISHTSSPFSHRAKQGANSSVQSMEISHDAIQGAKFSF